jgi:hypothetical protein
VLFAKPHIPGFKPILIDFYLGPSTRLGISAFVGQVLKNLFQRNIFVRALIGDGLRRQIEALSLKNPEGFKFFFSFLINVVDTNKAAVSAPPSQLPPSSYPSASPSPVASLSPAASPVASLSPAASLVPFPPPSPLPFPSSSPSPSASFSPFPFVTYVPVSSSSSPSSSSSSSSSSVAVPKSFLLPPLYSSQLTLPFSKSFPFSHVAGITVASDNHSMTSPFAFVNQSKVCLFMNV